MKSKEQIKRELSKWGITEYVIIQRDSNLYNGKHVNVNQNIDWSGMELTELPDLGIYRVHGNFIVKGNKLLNLKNSPIEITGNYDCSYNMLETLENCETQKVMKVFYCGSNNLRNMKGCPPVILSSIHVEGNPLESLEGIGASRRLSTAVVGARETSFSESLKEEIEIYRACIQKLIWNANLSFVENLEVLIKVDPNFLRKEWKLLSEIREKYRGLDLGNFIGIV